MHLAMNDDGDDDEYSSINVVAVLVFRTYVVCFFAFSRGRIKINKKSQMKIVIIIVVVVVVVNGSPICCVVELNWMDGRACLHTVFVDSVRLLAAFGVLVSSLKNNKNNINNISSKKLIRVFS